MSEAGLADILREALAPVAADFELAFIFGSVAQDKEPAGSDVDGTVTVSGKLSLDVPPGTLKNILKQASLK